MPQLLSFVDSETESRTSGMAEDGKQPANGVQSSKPTMWRKFGSLFKNCDEGSSKDGEERLQTQQESIQQVVPETQNSGQRRPSRKAVPSLPRPQTFQRQNSERRERLCPVEPAPEERRAVSVDRRTNPPIKRTRSPPPLSLPSLSAPDIGSPASGAIACSIFDTIEGKAGHQDVDEEDKEEDSPGEPPPGLPPPASTTGPETDRDRLSDGFDDNSMQHELESKWILNLSMHFRDKSDREKFFLTYAFQPNEWKRVTVSCDYRDAPPDSLEADLKSLHYQRDKSARIYESIHDSLPDIQFYSTVTNLKLQTEGTRLHVHVTEDVNEIIAYPPISTVQHLTCPRYPEQSVHFQSHLSGFVYKVEIGGRSLIKKEIPGPDTVDEFLYEINALNSLADSPNVIRLEGLVVSNDGELVKGLVIDVAERGALIDLMYDEKGRLLWGRRERWAHQIVRGLSEIHEAGFVQGDFTLSNIVIDKHDNAQIIDINRRGCPVGWEPPELAVLIESGQRISMHIGVKTDLFQLGMVLWALARGEDEPERQERPLEFEEGAHEGTPKYFQEIVRLCLSDNPRHRPAARELLFKFPPISDEHAKGELDGAGQSTSTHRSDKEYIDPETAINLDDIEAYKRRRCRPAGSDFSNTEDVTYADADPSTDYRFDSSGSCLVGRGRSAVSSSRRRNDSPFARPISSTSSGSGQVMHRYEHAESASNWEPVSVPDDAFEFHSGDYDKDKREEVIRDGEKTEIIDRSPLEETPKGRSYSRSPATLNRKRDNSDLKGTAERASTWNFPPPLHQDSGFDELLSSMTGGSDSPTSPDQRNYVFNSSSSHGLAGLALATPRTEIRVPSDAILQDSNAPSSTSTPTPQQRPRLPNLEIDDILTSIPMSIRAPELNRTDSSSSGPFSHQWLGLTRGTGSRSSVTAVPTPPSSVKKEATS
ncbi:MAG: hypothetical protein M1820_002879 [Bogoriella megaspora]|nr:MAG: hypothetical protein M1820_002879 [Bogoriella megaspora]